MVVGGWDLLVDPTSFAVDDRERWYTLSFGAERRLGDGCGSRAGFGEIE